MEMLAKVFASGVAMLGASYLTINTLFPWLKYDLKILRVGLKLKKYRDICEKLFAIDRFEQRVEEHPKKTFLIYEDSVYSYEFVDQMACRVANVAKSWGLKQGDTVALMMENEPAFVWTFLALQKLGIAVPLINHNLSQDPLVHCLLLMDVKCIIIGSGEHVLCAVFDVLAKLKNVPVYVQGLDSKPPPPGMLSFDPLLTTAALSREEGRAVRSSLKPSDPCCYIYTSGTTGTPKAATLSQWKASALTIMQTLVDATPEDIVYNTLPLYHSSGGGLGMVATIGSGATMVLKKKFSASQFWDDCRRHNVTVIQYIGELFRYLLAQPPNPKDTEHKVRAAFGNGLRKDIWTEVQTRFGLKNICEFFAATEGSTLIFNNANRPGAVGRISPFLNLLDKEPKALVKFDYTTATPTRDNTGRCMKVAIGEPGLFLSLVPEQWIRSGNYSVYSRNKEASEKKLVRNVFVEGDVYFNFGDVFVMDSDYFVYFYDRIGDTFRWKGENVSTTEVANQISTLPYIRDANVYGVTIPGHDGRAGMAALTLKDGANLREAELQQLYNVVSENLPKYARPLFIRYLDQEYITSTFKQQKLDLVTQAYDLEKVEEPLFYLDTHGGTYSPLTASALDHFLASKL